MKESEVLDGGAPDETTIAPVVKYGKGRPKKGEIRPKKERPPSERPVGRPRIHEKKERKPRGEKKGRKSNNELGTSVFSLGREYIDLMAEIGQQEERPLSNLVRSLIDRLRVHFNKLPGVNLPAATFSLEKGEYSPGKVGYGLGTSAKTSFSLGTEHRTLLSEMGKIRDRSLWGVDKKDRMPRGMTALLREELDRYATEHGYTPVNAPISVVVVAKKSGDL